MEKVYPSDLTDKQWNLIKPHIPDAKEGGRPRITAWFIFRNTMTARLKDG